MKLDIDIQRSIIYFMKGAMQANELAFVKECFDGGELELVDVLMEIAEPVALTIHNHYWPNYQEDWSGVVDYEVTEELGEKYIENWSVILENNQNDAPSLEHVSHLLHSAMREYLHPDISWHPLLTLKDETPTEPEERLPPASSGTPMPQVKPAKQPEPQVTVTKEDIRSRYNELTYLIDLYYPGLSRIWDLEFRVLDHLDMEMNTTQDVDTFFLWVEEKGMDSEYEQWLLGNPNEPLVAFLIQQKDRVLSLYNLVEQHNV